jgi:enoyl-CoA hydratase
MTTAKEDGGQLPAFAQVIYERPAPKVARITLNRPEKRNAQGLQMLYDINEAFNVACRDDEVSVLVLAAAGPDFSAGHDLSGKDEKPLDQFPLVGTWGQFRAPGQEGMYGREKEIYIELTERWRNMPKPLIAQVHGRVIAGGNMLVWIADLIVASEDATFLDNAPDIGIHGVEWFNHPYELGIRRAKEWLLMTEWMSAAEAHRVGMVNRVVPRAQLADTVLAMAERMAQKPLFTLKAIKEAVNNAQDLMGRRENHAFTFALHHMLHSHFTRTQGYPIAIDQLNTKVKSSLEANRPELKKPR